MSRGNCGSCGAEVIWIKTAAGKNCPLNVKPRKVYVLQGPTPTLVDGYATHFETCPNAEQHRKPKEAAETT